MGNVGSNDVAVSALRFQFNTRIAQVHEQWAFKHSTLEAAIEGFDKRAVSGFPVREKWRMSSFAKAQRSMLLTKNSLQLSTPKVLGSWRSAGAFKSWSHILNFVAEAGGRGC